MVGELPSASLTTSFFSRQRLLIRRFPFRRSRISFDGHFVKPASTLRRGRRATSRCLTHSRVAPISKKFSVPVIGRVPRRSSVTTSVQRLLCHNSEGKRTIGRSERPTAPDWLEASRPLFDFCAKRASLLAFGTFVWKISNRHHPPKRLVFGRRNVLLLTKVSL